MSEGRDIFLMIWGGWFERGITKNVHFAGVFGTAVEWSNAYLDVNEICNNVLRRTISDVFVGGQNRINRFKIVAILNT